MKQRFSRSQFSAAVVVLLIYSAVAGAADATAKSEMALVDETQDRQFTGELGYEVYSSVNKSDATNYSGSYSIAGGVSWKKSKISVTGAAVVAQNYSYVDDEIGQGDFAKPVSLSVTKGYDIPVFNTFSVGLSAGIPVSKESRRSTLRGSLGPTVAMGLQIGRTTLVQHLGYTYNFFEYTIRDDGKVNNPHALTSVTGVSYKFTDHLSLDTQLALVQTISFQSVERTKTLYSIGLGYEITEQLSTSLGLSTLAGLLASDGSTQRLELLDPSDTQAFLGFSYKL